MAKSTLQMFQKLRICEKVYFDQLLIFLLLLLFHRTVLLCHILLFGCWIWVSDSLDPDQVGHYVGPNLGPNCLQRLSTDTDNKCHP